METIHPGRQRCRPSFCPGYELLPSRQWVFQQRRTGRKLSGQDNLINIAKNAEIINEIKISANSGNLSLVDKKIAEIKGVLIAGKRVHNDKLEDIETLLQSLSDSQKNINKVLINPINNGDFDAEVLFCTLDETRDLFFEIIDKCKYD